MSNQDWFGVAASVALLLLGIWMVFVARWCVMLADRLETLERVLGHMCRERSRNALLKEEQNGVKAEKGQ